MSVMSDVAQCNIMMNGLINSHADI